ncbi:MAG: bactofilin family protein, partial [Candidatus Acidiferrales bacterium]
MVILVVRSTGFVGAEMALRLRQRERQVGRPGSGRTSQSKAQGWHQRWRNKKPETPQAQPEIKNLNPPAAAKPAAATWEGITTMSTDAIRPMEATADRATARLGPSLHVKGEIAGNEDLVIEGSVEGLVQLDERKLTVGASAKVTADITAREVVVYGTVKGKLQAKNRIEIKKDGSATGFLLTALVDLDGALEISPVFNDDARRRQIAVDGAVLFNL